MLYLPSGTSMPTRVHGAFVSDAEVHRVVEVLKKSTPPDYIDEVLSGPKTPIPGFPAEEGEGGAIEDPEADALYDDAVRIVAVAVHNCVGTGLREQQLEIVELIVGDVQISHGADQGLPADDQICRLGGHGQRRHGRGLC